MATSASPLAVTPQVFVDNNAVASLAYDGLAPSLAGVDQLNFQVPATTRNGCAVPVAASQTLGSPSVTISIQKRWRAMQRSSDSVLGFDSVEYFEYRVARRYFYFLHRVVPCGPERSAANAREDLCTRPSGRAMSLTQVQYSFFAAEPINIRTCPVPGYSSLSAGAIQIQPPQGSAFFCAATAIAERWRDRMSNTLPTGFGVPGNYTITGAPGSPVRLNATLNVGSPIQVTTSFAEGTAISSSQPLTVQWTGGDAGSLVRVQISSQQPLTHQPDADPGAFANAYSVTYTYAKATDHTLTIQPACQGHAGIETPVTCSFGLPFSSNAQIVAEVLPDPNTLPAISVPGVTGPVQVSWQYTYDFTGLILGP